METRPKVLVVDDEPRILRFVRASLSLSGYEVITTTSGEEALQLVRAQNPDIMLLDLVMVPLDGLEVLDRLRAFSRMPVIVFTARSSAADEARRHGACGFVAKPFRPAELLERIKDALGNPPSADDA